jgi:UDP-N-acetylglucosamine/UDP-N-acetylgalactosamine diphosphorylase
MLLLFHGIHFSKERGCKESTCVDWQCFAACLPLLICRAHFEAGGYFGLSPNQVHFFQQGLLPCLTEEGKVIMENSSKVGVSRVGDTWVTGG